MTATLEPGQSTQAGDLVGLQAQLDQMSQRVRQLEDELEDERTRAQQLQEALDSRVIIEQAKGALSVRLGVEPDAAFDVIRQEARSTRRNLHTVAMEMLAGA